MVGSALSEQHLATFEQHAKLGWMKIIEAILK
jgi:hypothetical protein